MSRAFTMIELIFVIVVLGILAGVAIPKLAATRDDATLAAMRANLATIMTAVQTQHGADLIAGNSAWKTLNFTTTNKNADTHYNLSSLLSKPMKINADCTKTRNGFCEGEDNTVIIVVGGKRTKVTFNTADGTFDCGTDAAGVCK
ncbi:MAG: type II secretion system protein [Campylobacter sp.]